MTYVLGLTGSIGMGKTATAGMFRAEGVPVHDADAAVHALYAGAAAPLIASAFPGTVRDGVVDRPSLSKAVLGRPEAIARLEGIVHPLVAAERDAFIAGARARDVPLVVLDIPLLFETGGERICDAVVVVSAPESVQRERVLAREGMTEDRFEAILARQMPDSLKRSRGHMVIDTGRGLDVARRQVREIVRTLAGRPGRTA
jgi:dephospho-CoA kinase